MKRIFILICFIMANGAVMAQSKTDSQNPGNKVVIYADPTGNMVNIEIKDTTEKPVFRMYNRIGKEVTNKVIFENTGANKKRIDISSLMAGVYLIWYHVNGAYLAHKLVKT